MGKKFEMSFPAKGEKKITVMNLLIEVADEICDRYCKYPEICEAERKDPDEAEDLLYEKYCASCPLNKL